MIVTRNFYHSAFALVALTFFALPLAPAYASETPPEEEEPSSTGSTGAPGGTTVALPGGETPGSTGTAYENLPPQGGSPQTPPEGDPAPAPVGNVNDDEEEETSTNLVADNIIGTKRADHVILEEGDRVSGKVALRQGNDRLDLRADTPAVGEEINLGAGHDKIYLEAGCYGGYSGGRIAYTNYKGQPAKLARQGDVDCGSGQEVRRSIIYGGGGVDRLIMTGGILDYIVSDGGERDRIEYRGGKVIGLVGLRGGNDKIILAAEESDIGGPVGMGRGDDEVVLEAGCYAGYHGSGRGKNDDGRAQVDCGSGAVSRALIYGGDGTDTFTMSGGTLGYIKGENGVTDNVVYKGGTIQGNVRLRGGDDWLVLDAETPAIGGYVDMGAGDDTILLKAGCYYAYHAGSYSQATGAQGDADCDDDGIADGTLRAILYGGAGLDTLILGGGTIGDIYLDNEHFVYKSGTITGDIHGSGADNSFNLGGDSNEVEGILNGGAGEDEITVSEGVWAGYHGGLGDDTEVCDTSMTVATCLYGGLGADTFTLAGGTIGYITGEDDEVDTFVYESGTVEGSVNLGSGNDVAILRAEEVNIGGRISAGAGDDVVIVEAGCYASWQSAPGSDNQASVDCDGDGAANDTRSVIYGGAGRDTFTLRGGVIGEIVGQTLLSDKVIYEGGAIRGNILLHSGDDELTLSAGSPTHNGYVDIGGYVDMGSGDDAVLLTAGRWQVYYGGAPRRVEDTCVGCIFGGAGADRFRMEDGYLREISGDERDDDYVTYAGGRIDGHIRLYDGDDELTLSAENVDIGGYIDMGEDDDIVRIEAGCYGAWLGYERFYNEVFSVACDGQTPEDMPAIYGGDDDDTVVLAGGVLGSVYGASSLFDGDTFIYEGGRIADGVYLNGGDDVAVLKAENPDIGNYIDMGRGDDIVYLNAGCYAYWSGDVASGGPAGVDCDGDSTNDIGVPIFGGWGDDTLVMTGGVLGSVYGYGYGLFSSLYRNKVIYRGGTIRGSITLGAGDDELVLAAETADIGDYVDMGKHDDTVEVAAGCYAAWHGSAYAGVRRGQVDCDGDAQTAADDAPRIYAGEGNDTLIITGGVLGNVYSDLPSPSWRYAWSRPHWTMIEYRGGAIRGDIALGDGTDTLYLYAENVDIGGHIDMGGNQDNIYVKGGCYAGYDAGAPANSSPTRFAVDCDGDAQTAAVEVPMIYGGTEVDSFRLYDGVIGSVNLADTYTEHFTYRGGRIIGGITGSNGQRGDYVTFNAPVVDIGGVIDLGEGDDAIFVVRGCYAGYNGDVSDGNPAKALMDCDDDDTTPATMESMIYGGTGGDEFYLGTYLERPEDGGAVIGAVKGHDGEDEQFLLFYGALAYLDGGVGDDVIVLFREYGDANSGADIRFTGDCDDTKPGDQWICGGEGHDRLEYEYGIEIMTRDQHAGLEVDCVGQVSRYWYPSCLSIRYDYEDNEETETQAESFASGVEEVSVSPELGLWGGLTSALQGFGRDMMNGFVSGTQSNAPESMKHLFSGEVESNGPFHARQAHLRGTTTTALTMQGVSGATGSSSYQHDVNLIQHGFGQPAGEGLVAEGGFHLMQGTLTSSDRADQFFIEGYGAGMKFNYGAADVAMLGAWFDLESDDWGRPMDFSGTQWIVSAGLEREIAFGEFSIIPQARGFWQKTNIEEQGQISFSDEMIFTGKAGLVAQTGNHAFDVFFTRDNEASSLDTGLVQNHRVEDALEAGWRNYMASDNLSLTGELRYRRGLETGEDSYSAGVVLNRDF